MGRRNASTVIALTALLAWSCGGDDKKDDGEEETGEVADPGVSPAAAGEAADGEKKGLFGTVFKRGGGASVGASLAKVDLTAAFGSAAPSLTPAAAPAAGAAAAKKAAATDTAALWKHAPPDAAFGLVLAPGTFDSVTAALADFKRILEARPGGAPLVEMIRHGAGAPDVDIFDIGAFATKAGVDLDKGLAVFVTVDERVAMVLPITDLAAFRTAVEADASELNDETCVPSGGFRVCAEDPAYAKAAAAAHDSPLAKRVDTLPTWLRGDIELVAHLASFPGAKKELADLEPAMSEFGTVAVAANFAGGAFDVRAWLQGKRSGPVGDAFGSIPSADLTGESAGAVNWFHLRLPMALLLAEADIPDQDFPGGINLKRDLFENLTGEIVAFSRGKAFLSEHVTFGIRDPAAASKVMGFMCTGLAAKGMIEGQKNIKGGCEGTLDLGAMLAAQAPEAAALVTGMPKLPVSVAVRGKKIELKIGGVEGPSGQTAGNAGNAVTRELLTGNWNAVWWGMAFDPFGIMPRVLKDRIDKVALSNLDARAKSMLDVGRWLYSHVYDAGGAVALREDGLYFLGEVTTFAADPDAAYRAHEKAYEKLLAGDTSGYGAALDKIVKKHPDTLAANHARYVRRGVPMLGQMGVLGAGMAASVLVRESGSNDAPPIEPKTMKAVPQK